MSEKKDPSIKLFGKTIKIGSNFDRDSTAVSVEVDSRSTDSDHNMLCSKQSSNTSFKQAIVGHETDTEQNEEPSSSSSLEVSKTRTDPTPTIESLKASFNNEKETSSKDETKKEDQCDQTSGSSTQSQDQCHPKKPDKIIPCPRCKSMDTKFCYFNNYNVNQPRHFCKNCQRYWTSGGTMRNLAVGAGRRKSKSSSSTSQCRNYDIVIIPNNTSSQCGCSMNGKQDSNHTTSNDKSICCNVGAKTNGESRVNTTSLPPPLVCFTNNSWPYTWSPIPIQSGYPMSFYSPTPPPPPFLPCIPQGTLNSPSLGKHSRDGNEVKTWEEKSSESSRVVMPKRIRIDDPIEAANSSILATLGVNKNNDKLGLLNMVGGRFFGGFEQAKYDNNNQQQQQQQDNQISTEGLSRSYLALQANPAAFSWSLSFHENAY